MRGSRFLFEMGRQLKRLLASGRGARLTFGDESLLELLDLNLLRREARQADIAAGRISARDPGQRLLDCAVVWRELARRTGDPAALRKSASAAEQAWLQFRTERRDQAAALARCEQSRAAMLGAELFCEDGLNVAAEYVLSDAVAGLPKADAAWVKGALACLAARRSIGSGGLPEVLHLSTAFDSPIHGLEAAESPLATALRCQRAEVLIAHGARLREPLLFNMALIDLRAAGHGLDPGYQPLSWLRVQDLSGAALAGLGDATGDLGPIVEAIDLLTPAGNHLTPDHSPLEWASVRNTLGLALMAMADASDSPPTLQRALACFSEALAVLDDTPSSGLRAMVAQNRAACLIRRAELGANPRALDEAEAAFRKELVALNSRFDPVAWAVLQLNLARVYLARDSFRGRGAVGSEQAAEALDAALDVFGEHGLRSLADQAARELERARTCPSGPRELR